MTYTTLVDNIQTKGAFRLSSQLRDLARENVLARLADQETVVVASQLIGAIDAKIVELQGLLPSLAERAKSLETTITDLKLQIIDLTTLRTRCEMSNDDRGAIRVQEKITPVERQLMTHKAELRTLTNHRLDIEQKTGNLEAARREVAPLAQHG